MRFRSLPFLLVILTIGVAAQPAANAQQPATLHYTVSMEHPDRHFYHVVLRAVGLKGPVIDLRMPAWMPGYYQLLDYAKNLSGLRVVD
jgi:hypothetical protein